MPTDRQFCYTLDVLTDGSEHTGCGTLFLSVWKIPLSVRSATVTSDSTDASLSVSSDSDDDSSDIDSDNDSDEEEEEKNVPQQTKGPMIINDETAGESNSDHYSWLTGTPLGGGSGAVPDALPSERHTPVARYAISGVGDATARLCADQRFGLAPTRACFVPELGGASASVDGLSALFLALHGAGAPSLHVVFPSQAGRCAHSREKGDRGDFVEELASVILGAHKKLDIRTCEVREQSGSCDRDSVTWWKVYEDGHVIVHASSNVALLSPLSEGKDHRECESEGDSASTSLIFLYSFPTSRLRSNNRNLDKNPYCTLALFPPRCRNVAGAYQQLTGQNLPMIRDGVPMKSIDYVVFLSPDESFSFAFDGEKTEENSYLTPAKNSQILMTLPRNHVNSHHNDVEHNMSNEKVVNDAGILIRSQQLHRYFHSFMPSAFAEPRSQIISNYLTHAKEKMTDKGYLVMKSGTSIVLEQIRKKAIPLQMQPKPKIWDRRASIWTRKLKEEWTKPIKDSLQSFLLPKKISPMGLVTPNAATDENEIELEEETDSEEEDSKEALPIKIEDENEIDLDDVDEDEDEDEDEAYEPENRHPTSSILVIQGEVPKRNDNGEVHYTKDSSTVPGSGPRLVVLGTGSATPSAYRGASGYALILPTSNDGGEFDGVEQPYCCSSTGSGRRNPTLTTYDSKKDSDEIYVLDCGEGVSTMLSRNLGCINDWMQRVRGIWISHAHLDHYGGLPTLLRLLMKERESSCSRTIPTTSDTKHRLSKRPRRSFHDTVASIGRTSNRNGICNTVMKVPWVVAPAKVLRYLDLILDCQNGRSNDGKNVCFEPRLHHDPRQPPMGKSSPFLHFESIRVQHNCCPAYGLLVGWKKASSSPGRDHERPVSRELTKTSSCDHQFLCYSGDTRPSKSLVQACRRALQRRNPQSNRNDVRFLNGDETNDDVFLIHEATFRDTDAAMAHKKKHSTIREAFMVATDIPRCSRVLMTHFSQRYDNATSSPLSETTSGPPSVTERNQINERRDTNGTGSSSSNWRTKVWSDRFGNTSIDPPSIGLAVDGQWISLQ